MNFKDEQTKTNEVEEVKDDAANPAPTDSGAEGNPAEEIQNQQEGTDSGEEIDPASQVEAAMKELGLDKDPEPADEEPSDSKDENDSDDAKKGEDKPASDKPKTEEEEEAEVLAGVKTERGKERLQKMLAERKQARTQLEQLQGFIRNSGLDMDAFSNLMAIARMVSSPDPETQSKGLMALDSVRSELYKQIGKEAPGVDLLDGFDDLKKKVDAMELSREDALSIAKGRAVEMRQAEEMKQKQLIAQEHQRLQSFGDTAIKAFQQRSNDPFFSAKVDEIQKYFSKPGMIEQFVRTTPPERWVDSLLWLYDRVQPPAGSAARPAPVSTGTPITTQRARSTGNRVPQGLQDNADGIMKLMESMGL